jgi:ubiquinone/menaquinone biosynthesis C-methylase UbiE
VAGATYHRQELEIALANADAHRALPIIGPDVHRILDVGCGAGQTLIASRLRRDVTAVGMDPDLDALRMGTKLDRRLRFVCALGERLPFSSGSFDMVISRVALPYMKIRMALNEMSRVLRPGGKIWFLLHPFRMVAQEMLQYLQRLQVKPIIHRLYVVANGVLMNAFGVEVRSPFNGRYESFQTTRAMLRELRLAGFDEVRIDPHGRFEMSAVKAGLA